MGLQVLDRRFAPLPWNVTRDRVARDCRWAHEGLLLAWPGWHPSGPITAAAGGSLGVKNDPFRNDLTQGCHCQVGDGYRGRTYKVAAGSSYFGTIQPLVNVRQTDVPLPTSANCTVVLHYRKTDTTNRNSLALGTGPLNNAGEYLLAKVPDNTGTVQWYYGGAVEGTTLLSVGSLSFGDDVWVFTVGPRGMEIWQNGIRRGSNAATPTRTNGTNQYWGLFGGIGVLSSDAAESGCVLVYDRQLQAAEIAALSVDPWTPFRPARRRAARAGTATTPGTGGYGTGPYRQWWLPQYNPHTKTMQTNVQKAFAQKQPPKPKPVPPPKPPKPPKGGGGTTPGPVTPPPNPAPGPLGSPRRPVDDA